MVVLAGDRGVTDPVARAANVYGKSVVKFQNQTLLERAVSTLVNAKCINQIVIVGPSDECLQSYPQLISFLKVNNITRLSPESGPSASAYKGVIKFNYYPTLLVTCDLPLLNSQQIDKYCQRMQGLEADFVVTAVNYESIGHCMPQLKKTKYQFGSKQVCFANVFAVLREPGLRAIEYWQDIESSRKKPIEIIRKIDWLSILRYKLGMLTLEQAAKRLSEKVSAKVLIENSDVPNLALDVDSEHDYEVFTDYFKKI